MKKSVDGNNILYHYLQKITITEGTQLDKDVIKKIIIDLSIWIPPQMALVLPIIYPYAVRDNNCRSGMGKRVEAWGSPDEFGFFRDDNSLIKAVPRSYKINSPFFNEYNNYYLGNNFIASHVWRYDSKKDMLLTKKAETNSFIPNLTWLPKQISKLSDNEGLFAQKVIQGLSYRIYDKTMQKSHPMIRDIWKSLPKNNLADDIDLSRINYFVLDDIHLRKFTNKCLKNIDLILKYLDGPLKGNEKVHCSRYLKNLHKVPNKQKIKKFLSAYREIINT